ncbi:MAG: hypothetical protein KDC44_24010, partial [Phaeodactylibacter sp.]|nr:hypothetical protein [Phaeodactylibacter sp.]
GVGPQYDIDIYFWTGLPANEIFTVLWSNGVSTIIPANGNSTSLQDVPSGTYSAIATGASGCTFNIDPIDLPGAYLANPADQSICPGGATQLDLQIIGPAATISWSPSDGLSCTDCPTPIASPTETTFYQAVVDQGFACLEYVNVLVEVLDDCVWPGDTDTNKVVNHFDLLNIGLGFGQTGPSRPNASTNWEAQFAFDWTTSTPNSATNYKHADTDGNGLINADDTLAINLNWGLTHNLQGPPSEKTQLPIVQNLGALPFYVAPDTLIEGESASLGIILGESDSPANEVYGLAFSLTYDPSIVVPGSARVSLDNSWLGELNDDLISIQQNQVASGRIDIGITRTDGQPISGFGEIARLEIVIEDNIFLNNADPEKGLGVMEVVFGIENALLINHLEQEIGVNIYETVAFILDLSDGLKEIDAQNWTLHPNPSHQDWTLQAKSNTEAILVQVYQADGRLVWE